ncbi:MAG: hypothetical protein L3J23_08775 [Flavobacteriaceae bacterium]|nr:hypothetical protein [Flavobacteriaceae bacterium]
MNLEEEGQIKIINTIKILLHKKNKNIFENIDFENDSIFLEPIIFVLFNNKFNRNVEFKILEEILQGHYFKNKNVKINYIFNEKGIAYLPNLGYIKRGENKPFETIYLIKNTKIELLKYPIKLLNNIFINASNGNIDSSNCNINNELYKTNIEYLSNAMKYIKQSSKKQFESIEQCCKKIVLFKTNPKNTNSFTTINAHGIAFLNVYQDDYDEVFFVDDIAHQTGHIILNTILFKNKLFFKINEYEEVEIILKEKDHRNVKILIHALYTYYTTFVCLDNCISENLFNKSQNKEAIARIGFYLRKCTIDLTKFEKIITLYNGIDNVLTDNGAKFYLSIKNKYIEIFAKWKDAILKYNYKNQPYNFENKKFIKLNK